MKRFLLLLLFFISSNLYAGPGLLNSLGLNDDFDTPPSVDEAFQFSAEAIDAQNLLARWVVAEGNYLYRDKFALKSLTIKIVNY